MEVIHLTDFKSQFMTLLVPFSFVLIFFYYHWWFAIIISFLKYSQQPPMDNSRGLVVISLLSTQEMTASSVTAAQSFFSCFICLQSPAFLTFFFSILIIGFTDPGFVNFPKAMVNCLWTFYLYWLHPTSSSKHSYNYTFSLKNTYFLLYGLVILISTCSFLCVFIIFNNNNVKFSYFIDYIQNRILSAQ